MNELSLIIVTDEKRKKDGDYLRTLIGLKDDKDDKIIGVKDGAVQATLWTEQQYNQNYFQIDASQYVVFIGNDKFIKEKRERYHISNKYNEYGMKYGSFAKNAFLFVEDVVKRKEYEKFINKYSKLQANVREVKFKGKDAAQIAAAAGIGAGAELMTGVLGALTIITAGALLPVLAIGGAGGIAAGVTASRKYKKYKDQIIEQQYDYLVLKYYYDDLATFLES